jgi:TPR repeat protein
VQTLDYYHHLAEKEGDLNSAMTLATIYLYGYRDVEIDMPKAVKFLNMAVDSNVAAAQGHLGYVLATGMGGTPVDAERAFRLASLADRRQDSMGSLGLGYCYLKGIGVSMVICPLDLKPCSSYITNSCSRRCQPIYPKQLIYFKRPQVS